MRTLDGPAVAIDGDTVNLVRDYANAVRQATDWRIRADDLKSMLLARIPDGHVGVDDDGVPQVRHRLILAYVLDLKALEKHHRELVEQYRTKPRPQHRLDVL